MPVEGAGGTADFADVYRAQLAPVWRYVRSRVPNHHEAQDVTSEVFARAWRSWGRFDPKREVTPWLLRIAQRTVHDWLRRQSRNHRAWWTTTSLRTPWRNRARCRRRSFLPGKSWRR